MVRNMETGQNSFDDSKCVSIIIPTKNAGDFIERCLNSVRKQTYKNIEVLVVDAFSSDETVRIASRFEAKVLSIDAERARAKNIGISNCRGEFLLFLDADMELEKTVVEECVTVISTNTTIAGVVIPERSQGKGFWTEVIDFQRRLYAGSKIESARFFIKKPVEEVNGFDEDIVFYEESTLPQKIERGTGKIVDARIKSIIMHNELEFNLAAWLKKKRYYSETSRIYYERYATYAKMQTSILYRMKLLIANGNWKILLNNPMLTTGLLILKLLEFSFLKK
jgi:glycosyltransferase involved in cell wall biosynthesis